MRVLGSFRTRCKTIAGVMLGAWLFALSVGIAHGCGWFDADVAPAAVLALDTPAPANDDTGSSLDDEVCNTHAPAVTKAVKLPSIDVQPDTQPLLVTARHLPAVRILPAVLRLGQAAHRPSGVPPFLQFTHLRL